MRPQRAASRLSLATCFAVVLLVLYAVGIAWANLHPMPTPPGPEYVEYDLDPPPIAPLCPSGYTLDEIRGGRYSCRRDH